MQKRVISIGAILFTLVGWVWLWFTGSICPLPLGTVPAAIMLLIQVSMPLGIAALAAFLGLLFLFLICMKRGTKNCRKIAAAIILMDVSLSILFTLVSLWQLIGIAIDLLMILALFYRKRSSREAV